MKAPVLSTRASPPPPRLSSTVGTTLAPGRRCTASSRVLCVPPLRHPHIYSRESKCWSWKGFSACVRHTADLCVSSLPALPRRPGCRDGQPAAPALPPCGATSAAAAAAAKEQRVQPRQLLAEDRTELATQPDKFKCFFINNHFTLQG